MIEAIVASLEDGQWHALSEIKRGFRVSEGQYHETIVFLERFLIVNVDADGERINFGPAFLGLPV